MEKIDKIIKGLHNGEVTILVSNPGMGKTSYSLNLIKEIGMKTKIVIALFSLELASEDIINRICSIIGNIETSKIVSDSLSNDERVRLDMAHRVLNNIKLNVYDKRKMSLEDIELVSKGIDVQDELGIIFLDYLQLLKGEEHRLLNYIKTLAQELNVPVVVNYQLSNNKKIRTLDDVSKSVDNIILLNDMEDNIVNIKNINRKESKDYKFIFDSNTGSFR